MKNDTVVAIKVVKLEKFREVPKLHEFTINEIQTLSRIENQNIVRFIEMLKTQNNMYLIYDFCNGDTLEALIQKRKYLSEPETMKIFAQMLNAFKSLVRENILHRDLKPSNILFHDQIVKVADFGFCKSLLNNNDLTQTMVGSPIYMAPEVLKGCSYNSKADVWSLGVVLYECLFGFCPYEDKSIARLIMQIDNKELSFPRHINQISRKCEELVRSMLQVDPRRRVDWQQLMQITFYEDPAQSKITSGPQMIKKQSSSNLSHQSNQPMHPTNVLQDRTNIPLDDKWREIKLFLLNNWWHYLLEQNTQSSVNSQGLTFSQKTIILTYLLTKLACQQGDQIKKLLENDTKRLDRWEEFVQTQEFKTFQSTFQREADSLYLNFETFKGELQKSLRYIQGFDLVQSVRAEIINNQKQLDQKLLTQIIILFAEEQIERLTTFPEELHLKWLQNLNDLMETNQLNEFFDKNLNDINIKLNDHKYFDQMRKMGKEQLEDLLNQRLINMKIRITK
ncbi:hypothetical protein pb186bvf_008950 [Paramecium bursaria]